MSSEIAETKTALYRHFDEDGELLYVGISLNTIARLSQHQRHSEWFGLIARVEIQWFDNRQLAESAERQAILVERPRFNIAHAKQNVLDRLFAHLEAIGKRHVVDSSGRILDEHMRVTPEEMAAMVSKLG